MTEAQQATGTTWNTVSDVRTRYDELGTAAQGIISDSAITRALEDAQNEIKGVLRATWDVDATAYWSATNIVTYAPEVKAIHLKLTGARCFREGVWGSQSTMGAGAPGVYAAQLEEEAWLALDRLIEKGALLVARRTTSADGGAVSWTSGASTDPVFTYGSEETWPRTPDGGAERDEDPYA